ncbi:hypothetical protein BDB01DRAFT_803115 [Pilobolus umbonatus]|nr:hypothetical protein BDB01DRAFT_803115 [Pilobolus umbonatus]
MSQEDPIVYTIRLWEIDDPIPVQPAPPTPTLNELRKSTRNWEKEKVELDRIERSSYISRSLQSDKESLKNPQLQNELWGHISRKIYKNKSLQDKKEWNTLVTALRKLREGIYASHWSQEDYTFAIQVFESSVDCCVCAEDYNELFKSLRGLHDLYTLFPEAKKAYYVTLDILFLCCYTHDFQTAKDRLMQLTDTSNETIFIKQIFHCIFISHNSVRYFKLYNVCPYSAYRQIMSLYHPTIRKQAIEILRQAYLFTSIHWVQQWLGTEDVLSLINELVPACVSKVENGRIYFIRRKK